MTDLKTTAALSVLVTLETKTATETRPLGRALAPFLKVEDLLILEGGLGAGKTTFTQGLGAGLQVQQWVTSSIFTIARTHPVAPGSGLIPLVHVDVYGLQAGDDTESLDLDSALEDSIVAVEWGKGKTEGISPHTLTVEIARSETTLPPDSDFADILGDTPCVLIFRASARVWDSFGLPTAWEALVRQAWDSWWWWLPDGSSWTR